MSTAISGNDTGTREAVSESGRLGVVPPGDAGTGRGLSSPACDAVPGRGVYHRLHHSGPAVPPAPGTVCPDAAAGRRAECRRGGIPPRSAAGRRRAEPSASLPGRAVLHRCATARRVRGSAPRPPHPTEYVERAQVGLAALTLAAVSSALVVIALIAIAHLRAEPVVPSAPETVFPVPEPYSVPAGGAQR